MLYANTDEGSSALWVLDGDGVVIDNISYSIADRAPILAQINEHYGTSFTGWSDNEIGLRIGDTVPNWNAYEKIEMPLNLSALIPFNETRYIAIDVFNGESGTIMCSGNSPMLINESKVFVSPGPPFSAGEEKAKEFILEHYSINITNWSANNQSLSPGSTIPNSENYIIMD